MRTSQGGNEPVTEFFGPGEFGDADDFVFEDEIEELLEGDSGTSIPTSVLDALEDGEIPAVVEAVFQALQIGRRDDAEDAIVEAFLFLQDEDHAPVWADAFAAGLLKGGITGETFAGAANKILKRDGCNRTRPMLADAHRRAIQNGSERNFLDSLVYNKRIADCLFDMCDSDLLRQCCSFGETSCLCVSGVCKYTLYKESPRQIWQCHDCEEDKCLCPAEIKAL